ncbi:MAG: rhomboid family intramembrane serine protease [Verrucomicrobiota bacterium]
MGIYDRDYMQNDRQQRSWIAGTPFIVWLFIAANIATFILQTGFRDSWGFEYPPADEAPNMAELRKEATGDEHFGSLARKAMDDYNDRIRRSGGVSVESLKAGQWWTLITHQFVNVHIFHLAFCCVGIFFIGREVVRRMGSIPFVLAYLVGGAFGALPILSVQLLPTSTVVSQLGATASVSALFGYLAMAMPDMRLNFLVFTLPIRSGLRRMAHVWAMGNIALFGLSFAFPGIGVGWAANFAGILFGLGLGKVFSPEVFAQRQKAKAQKPKAQSYRKRADNPNIIETEFTDSSMSTPEPEPEPDYNAVLDKINREGIGSLSAAEKAVLEKASDDLKNN